MMVLDRVAERLTELGDKPSAEYSKRELDLLLSLPNSIKALAGCSDGGVDLAADGLALKHVIEQLEKDLNTLT